MTTRNPLPRTAARDTALAMATLVLASTAVLVAAWTVRSEAREESRTTSRSSTHYSYGSSDERGGFSYALMTPGNHSISSSNEGDWKKIQKLMDSIDEDALWFSFEGNDYLVDDRDAIAEAREIVKPMEELGERQGKLGAVQGELGAQQGRIGAKQGALGARQGELGARLAQVVLDPDADAERAKIEREMSELGRRQEALSREQEPLARRQEELGRKQSELGRQQEIVSAKAQSALRELAEECVKNGKAKRM